MGKCQVIRVLSFFLFLFIFRTGPNIPDGPCQNQIDCVDIGWTSPLPNCEDSVCQCRPGTCPVYTTTYPSYSFFCGSCGKLSARSHTHTPHLHMTTHLNAHLTLVALITRTVLKLICRQHDKELSTSHSSVYDNKKYHTARSYLQDLAFTL